MPQHVLPQVLSRSQGMIDQRPVAGSWLLYQFLFDASLLWMMAVTAA